MSPFPVELISGWLTEVLRQNGFLKRGEVRSIETSEIGAFNSRSLLLKVGYTKDADPSTPEGLVLKRNTPATWSKEAGRDEVAFYTLTKKSETLAKAVPPCIAAAYDESTSDSYILLKDLTETHAPPITRDDQISLVRGVPLPAYQEAVIDCLAQLHAAMWNHPRLETEPFWVGYWSRDLERFTRYLENRQASGPN